MCAVCGCSGDGPGQHHVHGHGDHSHPHDHVAADGPRIDHVAADGPGIDRVAADGPRIDHVAADGPGVAHDRQASTIAIERNVLAHNDGLARENRRWFATRTVFAMNILSSPGAGKTTLLERMIREGTGGRAVAVIEGDQATDRDAQRIRRAGARAVQVNTGAGCHLDAAMIGRAVEELRPAGKTLLLIENVGNLVCPALFDLGENAKVLVASVPEGDDKPLKYPHMFRAADAVILNKTDLLRHVRFDVDRFVTDVRAVNPSADILLVSALLGDGFAGFDRWLRARISRTEGAS